MPLRISGKINTRGVFKIYQPKSDERVYPPDGQSPNDGSIDLDPNNLTLVASTFSYNGRLQTHTMSHWQIANDFDFTDIIYESIDDSVNLESISIVDLPHNGSVKYWRVRYSGNTTGYSLWSSPFTFAFISPLESKYVVFAVTNTAPYIHAWRYFNGVFEHKYDEPLTPINGDSRYVSMHPSRKWVLVSRYQMSNSAVSDTFIYEWDDETGFGNQIIAPTVGAQFLASKFSTDGKYISEARSFSSTSTVQAVTIIPFDSDTGTFGTRYNAGYGSQTVTSTAIGNSNTVFALNSTTLNAWDLDPVLNTVGVRRPSPIPTNGSGDVLLSKSNKLVVTGSSTGTATIHRVKQDGAFSGAYGDPIDPTTLTTARHADISESDSLVVMSGTGGDTLCAYRFRESDGFGLKYPAPVPTGNISTLAGGCKISDDEAAISVAVQASAGEPCLLVYKFDRVNGFGIPTSPDNFTDVVAYHSTISRIPSNIVSKPIAISPSTGDKLVDMTSIELVASEYNVYGDTQSHVASQWQIASDFEFESIIYDSGYDDVNLESISPIGLNNNTNSYYWRVRYIGSVTGESRWSTPNYFSDAGYSYDGGHVVFALSGTTPYLHAWRLVDGEIKFKYDNPRYHIATLRNISLHPSGKWLLANRLISTNSSTNATYAYRWDDVYGWGDPEVAPTISAFTQYSQFSKGGNFVCEAKSHSSTDIPTATSIIPFNPDTGEFGVRSNPSFSTRTVTAVGMNESENVVYAARSVDPGLTLFEYDPINNIWGPSVNMTTYTTRGNVTIGTNSMLMIGSSSATPPTFMEMMPDTAKEVSAFGGPIESTTLATSKHSDISYDNSIAAISGTGGDILSVYKFRKNDGFGSKYPSPVGLTNLSSDAGGCSISKDKKYISIATQSDNGDPCLHIYPFDMITGLGDPIVPTDFTSVVGYKSIIHTVPKSTVVTPTNISPSHADIDIDMTSVTLVSSAYEYSITSQSHIASQWQIANDENFTDIIYDSGNDAINLESINVPGLSNTGSTVYWRVRHEGSLSGYSEWSLPSMFRDINRSVSGGYVVLAVSRDKPFIHAWRFEGGEFKYKYDNPKFFPNTECNYISMHPSRKWILMSRYVYSNAAVNDHFIIEWDDATGFGNAKVVPSIGYTSYSGKFSRSGDYICESRGFSSMTVTTSTSLVPFDSVTGDFGVRVNCGSSGKGAYSHMSLNNLVVANSQDSANRLRLWNFNPSTDTFGPLITSPANISQYDVVINISGDVVLVGGTTFPTVHKIDPDTADYITKYDDPIESSTLTTCKFVTISSDNSVIAFAGIGGDTICAYQFDTVTGFGNKYSPPTSTGNTNAASGGLTFSDDDAYISVGVDTSTSGGGSVIVYPFSSGWGNPIYAPGSDDMVTYQAIITKVP